MMFSKVKKLNLKKPVLMFTGGVDSALLAYLLLKNDIDFVAFHVEMLDKYQLTHAENVIIFLEKHFNKKIKFVVSIPIYTINHPTMTEKIWDDFILKNKFDCKFTGKTKNPPINFYANEFNRPVDRDIQSVQIKKNKINEHEFYFITPFSNLDKKDLFKIYKEENLLDNLYPLTFSCSLVYKKEHCEICWWCKERLWGFEKIG